MDRIGQITTPFMYIENSNEIMHLIALIVHFVNSFMELCWRSIVLIIETKLQVNL